MKKWIPGVLTTFIFISMLFSSKAVFNGAASGILLWFRIVLPTLFPFMLISSLLLATGGLTVISRTTGGIFRKIFATSGHGSYAVLCGFLCGYPMGAKSAADLIRAGKITDREGAYLLSFNNNTSPVFIMNFIVWKTLGQERLLLPTMLILYLVPVLISFATRKYYLNGEKYFQNCGSKRKKENAFRFAVVDDCMMGSFEAILKVGGYIILFSIILSLLRQLSLKIDLWYILLSSLEITNGIRLISGQFQGSVFCYPLILGLTSFGGFCAAAQTKCMLEGTKIRLFPYVIQKLAAAATASLFGFLYISLVSAI